MTKIANIAVWVSIAINAFWMFMNWMVTRSNRKITKLLDERSGALDGRSKAVMDHSRATDALRESMDKLEEAREARLALALEIVEKKTLEDVMES